MDWNDLRYFLAVANSKSLSAAARGLKVSTSTVSRRIAAFEQALGVTLFRRNFDGYELTEAGKNLLGPASQAGMHFLDLERSAKGSNDETSGLVRIDVPELLGQKILIPSFASFSAAYPDIRLDIRSSVRPVQLTGHQSDIVLRIVAPQRGGYKMRNVGKLGFGLYAHQAYIDAFGKPASRADLQSHRVIGWSEDLRYLTMSLWLDELLVGHEPVMRLDSFSAQLHAVESGLGIAVMPHFAAHQASLIRVLEDVPPLSPDLWLLVEEQSARIPRVQLVKKHLANILSKLRPELGEKRHFSSYEA